MSVDSNNVAAFRHAIHANPRCALTFLKCARQPSEKEKVRDSDERQHLWPRDKPDQASQGA